MLERLLAGLGVLIYHLGLASLLIRLNCGAPKVLMYHACDDQETDFTRGLSINTTPAQFGSHLEFLRRHYEVMSLEELLEKSGTGPRVSITFDDGFRSFYENAWPLLLERGLSATCYLTTDIIGNEAMIWINEVNWFLRRHANLSRPVVARRLGMERDCRVEVFTATFIERFDRELIRQVLDELRTVVGVDGRVLARDHLLYLDWQQVGELSRAGIRFGNHTASHPPLAALPLEEVRDEIRKAALALSHLPGAGTSLAYPFGSRSDRVRTVALELGNRSLLEVEGINAPLDPTRIGRIKVRDFSVGGLFAHMEIVEPVKASLKRWLRPRRAETTAPES
jgi:peptidoglycan/xylan/chitin deacetylase (PgdA/CDA1 family)